LVAVVTEEQAELVLLLLFERYGAAARLRQTEPGRGPFVRFTHDVAGYDQGAAGARPAPDSHRRP